MLEARDVGPTQVSRQALSCGDYAAIFAQVPELGSMTNMVRRSGSSRATLARSSLSC